MLPIIHSKQERPQHKITGQTKRRMWALPDEPLRFGITIFASMCAKIDGRDMDGSMLGDSLHRVSIDGHKVGSQYLMTTHDVVDCPRQCVDVEITRQS